ncbi:MAG: DUF2500 domain-containing protein [Lachnospiraceae bacterium]|nr:DUF2500 domain-containing protein [Lachnospiraceae bacterium]
MGFGMMGDIFPIMFMLLFSIVIGMFAFTAISGIKTWNRNNNSPRLTVPAKVVSKRMDVSRHQHHNAGDATGAHGYHTTSTTSYFVTFEVESGDRMELHVPGTEYGMLVEGDTGRLTFQGTRYLSFERNIF